MNAKLFAEVCRFWESDLLKTAEHFAQRGLQREVQELKSKASVFGNLAEVAESPERFKAWVYTAKCFGFRPEGER